MGAGASATSMTSQNGLFEKQKLKAAKKRSKKSSAPVDPVVPLGADSPRQQESTCKGGRKTPQTEITLQNVKIYSGDESDVEPLHV